MTFCSERRAIMNTTAAVVWVAPVGAEACAVLCDSMTTWTPTSRCMSCINRFVTSTAVKCASRTTCTETSSAPIGFFWIPSAFFGNELFFYVALLLWIFQEIPHQRRLCTYGQFSWGDTFFRFEHESAKTMKAIANSLKVSQVKLLVC